MKRCIKLIKTELRSIDYLLLFPVNEQEKDHLITQVKN